MPFRRTLVVALACGLASSAVAANAATLRATEVASQTFSISTPHGPANEPFLISLDWSQPQPAVARAVIVFHGVGRDVTGYYRTIQDAAQQAGPAGRDTLIIAPQFLGEEDVREHHLPKEVLRWHRVAWEGGEAALSPSPISSYAVVDALLARLADRSVFPNLKTVVLAGHSGGGQLVQRYAAVGRSAAALAAAGIQVRYVIANPSSYLYFSDERPGAGGGGRCRSSIVGSMARSIRLHTSSSIPASPGLSASGTMRNATSSTCWAPRISIRTRKIWMFPVPPKLRGPRVCSAGRHISPTCIRAIYPAGISGFGWCPAWPTPRAKCSLPLAA